MSTVTKFNRPGDRQFLHLSHLLMYFHSGLFSSIDVTPYQQTQVFNGQRFLLPAPVDEAKDRVLLAVVGEGSLKLMDDFLGNLYAKVNKKLEEIPGMKAAGLDPLTVKTLVIMDATREIGDLLGLVHGAVERQHPALAKVKSRTIDASSPDDVMAWMQKQIASLRKSYGSEWVEMRIDHGLSNDVVRQITLSSESSAQKSPEPYTE